MSGTIGFDLDVSGERLRVGAMKRARHWTLVAGMFPEVQVSDLDLSRAKRILARRLEPEVDRLRRQREKEGR